jgi:hypothetical protein
LAEFAGARIRTEADLNVKTVWIARGFDAESSITGTRPHIFSPAAILARESLSAGGMASKDAGYRMNNREGYRDGGTAFIVGDLAIYNRATVRLDWRSLCAL